MMKYFATSIVIVLLCSILVNAQSATPQRKFKHSGKIITNYDKSKNLTTVYLQPYQAAPITVVGKNPGSITAFAAGFKYEGTQSSGNPETIEFVVEITRGDQRVDRLELADLSATVDGEQINLGKLKTLSSKLLDFSVLGSGQSIYTEINGVILTKDALRKLAAGKEVELRTGNIKLKLKDSHLEALRDLASRIQP